MSSLGFTSKEQRNLGLLVHLMTSNPKILYAPVGTEVDKVILKVRVQRLGPPSFLSHLPCRDLLAQAGRAGRHGPAARSLRLPWPLPVMGEQMPLWLLAIPESGVALPLHVLCDLPSPQANETFAFVGNVTHYAKVWLNISPEIRAYLEEGRLQRRIRWLQQVGWCSGD